MSEQFHKLSFYIQQILFKGQQTFFIRSLLPQELKTTTICQILDAPNVLPSSGFHLKDGLLYRGKCLYILEGYLRLVVLKMS